jgi:hypothetical protein
MDLYPRKLLLAVLLSLVGGSVQAEAWRLVKDQGGIQVYLQRLADSKYQAYRGVVTINSDVSSLLKLQDDVGASCSWIHSCSYQQLVGHNEDHSWIYSRFDAPWPVSPRDSVVQVTTVQGADGVVTRVLQGVSDHAPEQKGFIRVTKLDGFWRFTPKGSTQVEVVYQVHTEPGGSVPSWLANSFVVDAPFNTLSALRALAENR